MTTAAVDTPMLITFPELPCPKCGESGNVKLDLAGVGPDTGFACDDCNGDFGTADVYALIASWGKVLAWVERAPAID